MNTAYFELTVRTKDIEKFSDFDEAEGDVNVSVLRWKSGTTVAQPHIEGVPYVGYCGPTGNSPAERWVYTGVGSQVEVMELVDDTYAIMAPVNDKGRVYRDQIEDQIREIEKFEATRRSVIEEINK